MPIDAGTAAQVRARAEDLDRRHAASEISTLMYARGMAALRDLAPGETASAVAAAAGLTPSGRPRMTAPDLSGCERIAAALTDDVLAAAGAADGPGRQVVEALRMKALLTLARHGRPRLAETLARVIQQGGGGPAAVERAIEQDGAEPLLVWRADVHEDGALRLEIDAAAPERLPEEGAAALERWLAEHLDPWRTHLREAHGLPARAGAREDELREISDAAAARVVAVLGGERFLRALADELPDALRAARSEVVNRRRDLRVAHEAVQELASAMERRLNALFVELGRVRKSERAIAPGNLDRVLTAIASLTEEVKGALELRPASPSAPGPEVARAIEELTQSVDEIRTHIVEPKSRKRATRAKNARKTKRGLLKRLLSRALHGDAQET